MESLRVTRVRHLVQQESFSIALTAYVLIPPEEVPIDPTRLAKVQEKAEKALAKHPDRKEVESFRTNLEYVINQVMESSWHGGSWLLAVTPTLAEAVFLPFPLEEDISIGKNLKPYPALYALYRVQTVFVGVVSENTARWFEGVGGRLFPLPLQSSVKEALQQLHKARNQLQHLSIEPSPYNELFSQMARASYTMALVKYADTLREVVHFYLKEEKVPVILMGEERILKEVSRNVEVQAGLNLISGIPESASPEIIQQNVEQYLHHQRAMLEQMYYPFLTYSEAQTPQEIWELLQDSLPSSPILFVEEGYTLPVQELIGNNKKSLPTKDAIDLLVAAVREKGGEVLFLPAGKLPQPLMLLLP
ncbi:MAG: hypothetical protein RMJ66_04220 [Bacteroidia bacterium]|nr:hypothetical protein [Bacteroidia bacterium]MDW8134253.1 hypothetical protein [Bacteroidia bacterium]